MTDRRISSLLDDAEPACMFLALPDSSTRVAFTQEMARNASRFSSSTKRANATALDTSLPLSTICGNRFR
jgi:hypothetical protein